MGTHAALRDLELAWTCAAKLANCPCKQLILILLTTTCPAWTKLANGVLQFTESQKTSTGSVPFKQIADFSSVKTAEVGKGRRIRTHQKQLKTTILIVLLSASPSKPAFFFVVRRAPTCDYVSDHVLEHSTLEALDRCAHVKNVTIPNPKRAPVIVKVRARPQGPTMQTLPAAREQRLIIDTRDSLRQLYENCGT